MPEQGASVTRFPQSGRVFPAWRTLPRISTFIQALCAIGGAPGGAEERGASMDYSRVSTPRGAGDVELQNAREIPVRAGA
ncbi:MAG TPA: hypothetical protein VFF87_05625 [Hyphomicrobium sp.]|nr:hypothetical protein [Hyphomicrobium sp.]